MSGRATTERGVPVFNSHIGKIVAAVAVAAAGWGCQALRPAAPPPPLAVERVELMADFTTNAFAYGRDAGNSIRMGSAILWVFGDTFTWTGLPSATAAWSSEEAPNELHEPVDTWFGSLQFYPFTAAETEFNETRDPPDCCRMSQGCSAGNLYCACPAGTDCATRIALWPGDLLPVDEDTAVQPYEKVWIGSASYDFDHLGTGVAFVERGATTARRARGADGEPLLLFGPDEPNFLRAVLVEEDSRRRAYLYAVDNRHGCGVDILVARVEMAAFLDRGAYQFWSGNGWSDSLADAVPVLRQIVGGLGSVTWNDHLQRYLSAFNDICSGGGSLALRTAPRPEGPWSEAIAVDISALGATPSSYAGQIHSSLGTGSTPVFTFYQPLELGVGRVRMGRLHLR
jgi:hypothetical protein